MSPQAVHAPYFPLRRSLSRPWLVPALLFLLLGSGAGCDGRSEAESGNAVEANVSAGEANASAATSSASTAPPGADLTLTLQDGKRVKLSDYRGKHVVLYFYPKDDTPGCRVEAQGFRDLHDEFVQREAVVLGVSTQDEASHQAFIAKEGLPFDLVVDPDGAVARAFDVPLMLGSLASRRTVLLDKQGIVRKRWDKVAPDAHAGEVLAALESL